uniref:(+)RNA virus helicase C-terminal domain-containing protein n=1 Tax=Chenopodium quinoa TaxID=63459 RepID=A0A803MDS9_CHEQI
MDLPPTQVVMPFRPLLKQITKYLNFPDPDYQFVDEPRSIACVVIKTDCGPIASVYIGGYTSSVEESCEVAARKAVYDLMKKYEIVVEDVTYLRKQMYDRCGQLFWLKKEDLERIEKEECKVCMYEDLHFETEDNYRKIVVDFVVILRAIFKTVEIRCTPIETIEHSPDEYTCWFTVMPHKEGIGFRCLFSDRCRTAVAAKQSLARKAIDYLSDVFNLVIVDANYKELEPSTVLIEQDCLTPLGQEFQVPVSIPPALPPKKRLLRHIYAETSPSAESGCEMVSVFPVPEDLAKCFKRAKRDRLLREPSSSKGYKTTRLKSLEYGSQDEMQRMQSLPAAKRPKIPKPKRPITKSSAYPFQFQRKQFPLKLSFAMTINKAQGKTLNKVVVYLPRSCFSHVQLYVALSRAREAANVSVITDVDADRLDLNVVSYDILCMAGII